MRCPRSRAWLAQGGITLNTPTDDPDVSCSLAYPSPGDPAPTLTRTAIRIFAAVMEPSASPAGSADLPLSQFGTRTDNAGRGGRRKPLEYLSNASSKLKEAQARITVSLIASSPAPRHPLTLRTPIPRVRRMF